MISILVVNPSWTSLKDGMGDDSIQAVTTRKGWRTQIWEGKQAGRFWEILGRSNGTSGLKPMAAGCHNLGCRPISANQTTVKLGEAALAPSIVDPAIKLAVNFPPDVPPLGVHSVYSHRRHHAHQCHHDASMGFQFPSRSPVLIISIKSSTLLHCSFPFPHHPTNSNSSRSLAPTTPVLVPLTLIYNPQPNNLYPDSLVSSPNPPLSQQQK